MPIVQRTLHVIYVHCYHPFVYVFFGLITWSMQGGIIPILFKYYIYLCVCIFMRAFHVFLWSLFNSLFELWLLDILGAGPPLLLGVLFTWRWYILIATQI